MDAGGATRDCGRPDTTLVLGLGNPVLGDDGVGWAVAEAVERALDAGAGGDVPGVEVDRLAVGGLRLMERLVGCRRAILVDSATFGGQPGTTTTIPLEDLPGGAGHLDSAHDASLRTALAVGRRLGADLPDEILVVAVETRSSYDFSEHLSPAVAAAVPVAAQAVVALLSGPPSGGP